MKRVLILSIIAVGSAVLAGQDAVEMRFNDVIRSTKHLFHISSFKRELEMLKNREQDLHQRFRNFILYLMSNGDFERYINRPVEQVHFDEKHEPQIANKYEQTIYDILDTKSVYREHIKSKKFFQVASGQYEQTRAYTQSFLKQMVAQKNNFEKNAVYFNDAGGDTEELRETIKRNRTIITKSEWHLTLHRQGGHYFLSIVKYGQEQAPITFLVDSYDGVSYDIGNENILVNAHFKLQNLGTDYEQSDVVDYNCHLYSFEFTKAAMRYLQENDLSLLERACMMQDYVSATNILHTGMKHYLPYYTFKDGSYVRKARTEIEKYHRNLRWEISGLSLVSEFKKITEQKLIAA
jgi:hypothetical protein